VGDEIDASIQEVNRILGVSDTASTEEGADANAASSEFTVNMKALLNVEYK
jgi:hypothetical protein